MRRGRRGGFKVLFVFVSEVNGRYLVHYVLFLLSTAAVQAAGAHSATFDPLWEVA